MARKPRNGPASDPELLILLSLATGPKHGYAIMSDVESIADVRLGPGTLYTAITRLVEKKLIAPETSPGRQRPTASPQRYHEPRRELNDMRRVAAVGLRRLRLA